MPLSQATIAFDLSGQTGIDYDRRRNLRGWVDTSVPSDTVVDTDGNKIRIGDGKVTINDDGTGSFTVWVPGTGSNPATWQTYLHIQYVPQGNPEVGRQTRTFGPFTITGNADLADLVAEQEVPPEYAGTLVTQMQALREEAEAARDEAVEIAAGDITATIGAVAGLEKRDQSTLRGVRTVPVTYSTRLAAVAGSTWEAGGVESPCIFLDPKSGRYAMVYTAYSGPGMTGNASHGIAFSDDGINWPQTEGADRYQLFTGTGVSGQVDAAATGPCIWYEDGVYHLFFIGLSVPGDYEGGLKSICYATATALTGPGAWTRHGAVVSRSGDGSGTFRANAVWHPNIVKRGRTYYMFFNATDDDGKERAGYATATSLAGPWTVDDTNAPLIDDTGHEFAGIFGGDPFVYEESPGVWRMVFSATNTGAGPGLVFSADGDYDAYTTDEEFPLGWKVRGRVTVGTPFKPWIVRLNGRTFHWGTNGATIVVKAESLPELVTDQAVPGRWQFNAPLGTAQKADVLVGPEVQLATGNKHKLNVGASSGDGEVNIAQDSTHGVTLGWFFNGTVGSAQAHLSTYGGSNPLRIQNNTGTVRLGGTGGKVGFYGATEVTKPAITGSRGGNAALASLLTQLAALGLITDSTTA